MKKEPLKEHANRSVTICDTCRTTTIGIQRLVGFKWSEATAQRGGQRKRLFTFRHSGIEALKKIQALRTKLWQQIPGLTSQV